MKLAMAQMSMSSSIEKNLEKALKFMHQAKAAGADLIFFPEVQLTPFFPQYPALDASSWLVTPDHPAILAIRQACRKLKLYASPNVYLSLDGKSYDASLMIDGQGEILGISKMVHIAQAKFFYEQDYYTPSDDGFKVFQTPFGNIGIVICFDRHLPESIRSCARQQADLVIIPTANLISEPMELFEWEVRVQAFQNTVFTAMCNRTGTEGEICFSGQSLAVSPEGELLLKAGSQEELLIADISIGDAARARKNRPWLSLSRDTPATASAASSTSKFPL